MASSPISIQLNSAVDLGIKTAAMDFAVRLVKQLAAEWGVSETTVTESIMRLNLMTSSADSTSALKVERTVARPRGRPGRKPKVSVEGASATDGSAVSASGGSSKPDLMLPFCGTVNDAWCYGIRKNYGLYSQCSNARPTESHYCKTCAKHAASSPAGKPQFGDIHDRMSIEPMEFREPVSNQRALPLINVIEKHIAPKIGRTVSEIRAEMESEAAKLGWKIPEENWVRYVAKRGAPKGVKRGTKKGDGVASVADTETDAGSVSSGTSDLLAAIGITAAPMVTKAQPKIEATGELNKRRQSTSPTTNSTTTASASVNTSTKMGNTNVKTMTATERAEMLAKMQAARAKKTGAVAPIMTTSTANTTASARNSSPYIAPAPISIPPNEDHDAASTADEEEAEVEVVKFVHAGRVYLRDESTNNIYDVDSEKQIGVYDPIKDVIMPADE